MSKTDFAFWLGIYAGLVASATGLWALFRELWLERARLDVAPSEAWLVPVKGSARPLIVRGERALETMGISESQRIPILEVTIRNRGRRDATIHTVSQSLGDGRVNVFGDLLPQIPFLIPAERTVTLVIGADGGYTHGDNRPERFFVLDGAGRVHPLRERSRQWRARRFWGGTSASEAEPWVSTDS